MKIKTNPEVTTCATTIITCDSADLIEAIRLLLKSRGNVVLDGKASVHITSGAHSSGIASINMVVKHGVDDA